MAVEKITIAELDLDVDALLKKYTSTRKEIDRLKEAQKELTKQGKRDTKQFSENEIALKTLGTQYNQQKKVLSQMTDQYNKITSVEKTYNRAINQENKSIEQARKNNKELLAIRNKLDLSTKEGIQQTEALNKKLDENNAFIKDNVSAYEEQKIGIGDYEGALRKVFPTGANIIGMLSGLKSGLQAKMVAMNGATKSTKAFRLALISTGIGAIVVALGSLIAAFSGTQKGIDAINKTLAPLKGAFQGIIGVVEDLAVNVFSSLGDRWTIVSGKILGGIDMIRLGWNKITGDEEEAAEIGERIKNRVQEISEAQERLNKKNAEFLKILKEAPERIKESADAQVEIEKLQIRIERAEINLVKQRAKSLRLIKEQNKIAEDTTKTEEVRKKAAETAIKETERLLKTEQGILDLKIKKTQLEQSQNDTSREEELELANLIAERTDKETQALEMQTTLQNKLNTITQQAKTQELKLIEQKNKALLLQAEEELRLFRETNQKKIEEGKFYSEQVFEQEKNRLEQSNAFELQKARELFDNKVITKQEYELRVNEIDAENTARRDENERLRNEAIAEQKAVDLENQRIIDEENFLNDFQIKTLRLEKQRKKELELAKKTGADTQLIKDKFALRQVKLEAAKNEAILQNNLALFGAISQLLGESTAVGKAVALFQAGINVQEGITKALAQGGVKGLFTAGIVAARGFKAVQKISSSDRPNTRFEKGGLQEIGGQRHSNGGTKFYGEDGTRFEAERGELIGVMSRTASKHFLNFNNAFTSGKSVVGKYASGGIVQRRQSVSNANDPQEFARIISDQVNKVQQVLVVEDVTNLQNQQVEVREFADI
jgi:hypothetical protein